MTHKLINNLIDSEGEIYRTPKSRMILSDPIPIGLISKENGLTAYNVLFGHDYEPYLANLTPAARDERPIENVPQKINEIITFDYSKNEDDPCDIRAIAYLLAIDANDKLIDMIKILQSKLDRNLIQFRAVSDQSIIPLIKIHLYELLSKCNPIQASEKGSIEEYINKKLSEFEPVLTGIIKSEVDKINVSTTEIKENITIYRNLVKMQQKYELEKIELLATHNKQKQQQLHDQIEEKMGELEELFKQMKKDPLDESIKTTSTSKLSTKRITSQTKLNSIEEEDTVNLDVEIENAPVLDNSEKSKVLEAKTNEAYEKYKKSIYEGVSQEEATRIMIQELFLN